jgi:hypothetical protein
LSHLARNRGRDRLLDRWQGGAVASDHEGRGDAGGAHQPGPAARSDVEIRGLLLLEVASRPFAHPAVCDHGDTVARLSTSQQADERPVYSNIIGCCPIDLTARLLMVWRLIRSVQEAHGLRRRRHRMASRSMSRGSRRSGSGGLSRFSTRAMCDTLHEVAVSGRIARPGALGSA